MHSASLVRLIGSLAIAAGVLSGCAEGEFGDSSEAGGPAEGQSEGAEDSPPTGSWRDQLTEATAFTVADAAGGSRASVTAVRLSDGEAVPVELAIVGGVMTLSLDDQDQATFDDLLIDSDDVLVSPSVVPPDGLNLTDLTVELAEPASVQLGSQAEDAVAGGAQLSVDVKWAVEVDHGVVDLAPIRLPALSFDLSLETGEDGRAVARLTATHEGTFWSWAGIFELRDLEIELVATSDA
jgi:hypothetical protein